MATRGNKPARPVRRGLATTVDSLQAELAELSESLRAIRRGEVDALVVRGGHGRQVMTLQGSDEPYRILIQSMREGVAILTADGSIAYCNPGLAALLGAPLGRVLGRPLTAYLQKADREAFGQLLELAAEGRAEREFPIVRRRREMSQAHFFVSPAAGAQGGFCLVATDVTEHHRNRTALRHSQTRLRESEQWLSVAHDAAEIGTWGYQMSTGRLQWSAQNFRLHGLDPASTSITVDAWLDRIDPRDRAAVAAKIRKHRLGGSFAFEARILLPGDRTRWLYSRGQVTAKGGEGGLWVLGASHDITELKEAGEALRSSEGRFRAVFDRAPLGICVMGADGRFLQVNPAYCNLLGYSEKELLAKNFQTITHPDDLAENMRLHRLAVAGKTSHYEMQKRYIRKDGMILWGRLQVGVILDSAGRPAHLMALVEDIAERRRADEAIQVMTDSLQRLSRRLLHLQDEERRRIARELHDGMGQSLSALKMNVERLCHAGALSERLQPVAEESVQLAGQLCREVRSLSYLLHPPLLDELGLESALAAYTKGVSERTGIAIELHLLPGFGRLASELETAVFRIVQEGLANIHRHSGSSRAQLKLERRAGEITLQLRDYGRGLTTSVNSFRGVGLAGIRERTSQLGGRFAIEPARPGLRLTVVLPVTAETRTIQ